MRLIESIASYTGESYSKAQQFLTEEVKTAIYNLVTGASKFSDVDTDLMKELLEMDVFAYAGTQWRPNTAIFLEKDIEKLYEPVFTLGNNLAAIVKDTGHELMSCSSNIRNFVGSIMGLGQGLHDSLKKMNLAVNWQNKTGKYEKMKVDFNEDCEAYRRFGEDLQLKRIHQGKAYTSVVIGPGKEDYVSYLWNARQTYPDKAEFYYHLINHLTDTLPLLILGQIEDESLMQVARTAHINITDIDTVIQVSQAAYYMPILQKISGACTEYILENMSLIQNLLSDTVIGRQGVPTDTMMMNFWRYLRRAVASRLYENGFLTDQIREKGTITIFYEKEIGFF